MSLEIYWLIVLLVGAAMTWLGIAALLTRKRTDK